MAPARSGLSRTAAIRGAKSRPSGEAGSNTTTSSRKIGAKRLAHSPGAKPGVSQARRWVAIPARASAASVAPSPTRSARPWASATTSAPPDGSTPARIGTRARIADIVERVMLKQRFSPSRAWRRMPSSANGQDAIGRTNRGAHALSLNNCGVSAPRGDCIASPVDVYTGGLEFKVEFINRVCRKSQH